MHIKINNFRFYNASTNARIRYHILYSMYFYFEREKKISSDKNINSFIGPVVWYQSFEYAVSHWLQKATEHVFGCVLCSPGCFSLFRASALMSDDVIKIYTRNPTSGLECIQYDQGLYIIFNK